MLSLLSTVEQELYWQLIRDEDGNETYPFDLEVSVVGGEVRDLWDVVWPSHYSVTLHIFEDEERYRSWVKANEYREFKDGGKVRKIV